MGAIDFLLILISAYVGVGLVFTLAFVVKGAEQIDHAAQGAPIAFRLLIVPGSAALWPLLAWKWFHANRHKGAT